MNNQLDFSIGDITFTITGLAKWLDIIDDKWHDWCKPAGPTMALHYDADTSMPLPEAQLFETLPVCHAGECTIQAPGFEGRISTKDASASIRMHPDAGIFDVVYFLRIATAVWAFHNGAVLFHSATVVHHERAYAFFGLSGSGKTTAAKLSDPDPVLSDDLVLIHPREQWVDAYATPFSKVRGKVMSARLAALLRLIKAPDIALVPLSPAQALGELVANSPVVAGDRAFLPQLMQRWQGVMQQVPVHKLRFRKEPSFWEVIDAELE